MDPLKSPSEHIADVLAAHCLTWLSPDDEAPWYDCQCGQHFDRIGKFVAHQAEQITQLPLAWVTR